MLDVEYLTAQQPQVQAGLQFFARSTIVDNYTANYVNIDGGRPCPPYTVGWITNLKSASQVAGAILAPASGTPPAPAPPSTPAYQVILTWTDELLTPSNGVSLIPLQVNIGSTGSVTIVGGSVGVSGTVQVNIQSQSGTLNVQFPSAQNVQITGSTATLTVQFASAQNVSITGQPVGISINAQLVNVNTQQPQTSLGNFVVAANGGTNNATYTLPTGTHALGIAVTGDGIVRGLLTLKVTGVTTGINYINLTGVVPQGSGLFGYFVAPTLSVLDTQVTVTGTTPASFNNSCTVYSVAILDAEGVYTFDNAQEPLATVIVNNVGAQSGTTQGNPFFANQTLAEVNGTGQQGTWNAGAVSIPGDLAAHQVVAANANRRGLIINNLGAGGVDIELSATAFSQIVVSLPNGGYWEMPSPVTTAAIYAATGNACTLEVTEIT